MTNQIPRADDTKFKVLFAIQALRGTSRMSPTVEEVRRKVGVSSRSTIQFHINDLVREGYLSQVPGKKRTLRTTTKGDMLVGIIIENDV